MGDGKIQLKDNETGGEYLITTQGEPEVEVELNDDPIVSEGKQECYENNEFEQEPELEIELGPEEEGEGLVDAKGKVMKSHSTIHRRYNDIIQNARQSKGLAPANNIVPLIVSGSFTRFDTDNITQEGMGQNLGTRTKRLAENELDNIWRKTTGETDIGTTSSARAISLVLNLTDPRNNLVVSSQAFDLIFYRNNKTFRLRIGVGDGYYGISKDHVEVEGVHAAQKTLVDAAAFWLLNKAYGGQTDFGRCFSDSQRKLTLTTEQLAEISAQNRAAQQALADKHTRLKRNTNNEDNKESKPVRPRS